MSLSGHTKSCGAAAGGVATLGLIAIADLVDSTITVTAGEVSALSLDTGKNFAKYQMEQDSCIFKDTVAKGDGSIGVEHTIEFFLEKMDKALRVTADEIKANSACGMVGIVKLFNGTKFLVGWSEDYTTERPLELESNENASGGALTDKNGGQFALKSMDVDYSLPIADGVDFDALFTPAS